MKSFLSCLAVAMLLTATTGCYCCRQSYDPCSGCSYSCKQWGFKLFDGGCRCDGCATGSGCYEGGCDDGCTSVAPGCDMPCASGAGYDYAPMTPTPTFQHQPGAPQQLRAAPPAPAPATEKEADLDFGIDETAGWAPSTDRHRVHTVR